MRRYLRAPGQARHTTTVYVTHDQVEAMTMADRIVVMNQGRVQQVGRPTEVYEHPANLFVAGFIGSPPMNFFAARRTDGGVAVRGHEIPVTGALDPCGEIDAVVGIRPEEVRFGEPDPGELSITGFIAAVETLGAETLCRVEADLTAVVVEAGVVTASAAGPGSFLVRTPGNRDDLAGAQVQLRAPIGALPRVRRRERAGCRRRRMRRLGAAGRRRHGPADSAVRRVRAHERHEEAPQRPMSDAA